MFAQCIPTVFPVFHLLGWTLPATSLFYFLSMTLHGLVWNTIHPGKFADKQTTWPTALQHYYMYARTTEASWALIWNHQFIYSHARIARRAADRGLPQLNLKVPQRYVNIISLNYSLQKILLLQGVNAMTGHVYLYRGMISTTSHFPRCNPAHVSSPLPINLTTIQLQTHRFSFLRVPPPQPHRSPRCIWSFKLQRLLPRHGSPRGSVKDVIESQVHLSEMWRLLPSPNRIATANSPKPLTITFTGTFMKQKDWEPKVRKNQAREIEGALMSSQM